MGHILHRRCMLEPHSPRRRLQRSLRPLRCLRRAYLQQRLLRFMAQAVDRYVGQHLCLALRSRLQPPSVHHIRNDLRRYSVPFRMRSARILLAASVKRSRIQSDQLPACIPAHLEYRHDKGRVQRPQGASLREGVRRRLHLHSRVFRHSSAGAG